jgi:hypothetical protein
MLSTQRLAAARAARRRGGLHHEGGNRRLGRAVDARRDLADGRVGRAWINGREAGGSNPHYAHLAASHD